MYVKIVETAGESIQECDSIALPDGEPNFIIWKNGEPETIDTTKRGPVWVYVMNNNGNTIERYKFNIESV